MNGIWCETCKYKDLDPYDEVCLECHATNLSIPPTGYVKVDPNEIVEHTEPVTTSAVDHPSHYQSEHGMECIDEMVLVFGKEAVKNFCICNVWKYRYRADAKNGQEDRDKADWYMKKFEELCKDGQWEQTHLDI